MIGSMIPACRIAFVIAGANARDISRESDTVLLKAIMPYGMIYPWMSCVQYS